MTDTIGFIGLGAICQQFTGKDRPPCGRCRAAENFGKHRVCRAADTEPRGIIGARMLCGLNASEGCNIVRVMPDRKSCGSGAR